MELGYLNTLPSGGFNFDNCIRNKALTECGSIGNTPVKTMKTGTTICGIIFKVRDWVLYVSHGESNYSLIKSRCINNLIINVGWCCASS